MDGSAGGIGNGSESAETAEVPGGDSPKESGIPDSAPGGSGSSDGSHLADDTDGTDGTGNSASADRAARRSWWRRHPRWSASVAVAAVVGGAFAGGWFTSPGDQSYTPRVADAQPVAVTGAHAADWQKYGFPTLGDKAGDRGPGRAAMKIWLSNGYGPHSWVNTPGIFTDTGPSFGDDHRATGKVLFSGTVPGLPRVTLVSSGGELLRYASGQSTDLVWTAPVPWEEGDDLGSPPLALGWDYHTDTKFPLAVPPWLTNVEVSGVSGKDTAWRPLKVTDGLSAPVPEFGATVGSDELVDAHGDCGIGVLIRADDSSTGTSHQVTYVYRPGWPYAVRVMYLRSDNPPANAPDAAPFDQAYVRRMAGALLCQAPGMEDTAPTSLVIWRPEWRGTPSPGGDEVAVVEQDVYHPRARDLGASSRSGVIEVGVDKASLYTELGSNYGAITDPGNPVLVGCATSGAGLTVVGPTTATVTRLFDPVTGRLWSGHGNVLTVPKARLPRKGTDLTATATTPGKAGGTDTGGCTAP
jgi:hypothetical protein